MNHNRANASAAILNGLIYVVGGSESGQMSNSVESYDPKTDEWNDRMELDRGELQPTLVAFNGMLYAFLDYHGVREYDPEKNVWTKVRRMAENSIRVNEFTHSIYIHSSKRIISSEVRSSSMIVCLR